MFAVLGLSLVVPFGITGRPVASRGGDTPRPPAATQTPDDEAAKGGVTGDPRILGPLIEFLGPDLKSPDHRGTPSRLQQEGAEPEPGRSCVDRLRQALQRQSINGFDWDPQFMIVTVPDPVDSARGERLDLLLDTLQSALKLDQLVLDRYVLPWVDYRHAAVRAATTHAAPPPRWYVQEPGLFLFRDVRTVYRHPDAKIPAARSRYRLVLVFLVGETPISGIHKEAFAKCVEVIQRLNVDPQRPVAIPVLGPYFSGSAYSLIESIGAVKPTAAGLHFDVISGSATNIDQARFEALPAPNVTASFAATVIPDAYVKNELIQYIAKRNWKVTPIAWLTESNTGYGGYATEPQDRDTGRVQKYRLVEYPFPLHISRLRAIYEAQPGETRDRNAWPAPERTRLDVPFNVLETARDTPPPIAPGITAAYAELILAHIFRSIHEQGIRYVGITATDPRDIVFLAESLREHCPDTQLMVVDSDLIYIHPSHRSAFHGALIGSTYPLFSMVQTWTPDDTIDIIRRIPLSEKNNLRKAGRQNEDAFWTELESSIETERQHEVSATGPSDGSLPGQIVSFSSGTQQGFYNAAQSAAPVVEGNAPRRSRGGAEGVRGS